MTHYPKMLDLTYNLTYDEIYEALVLFAGRKEGWLKLVQVIIMELISISCLIIYAMDTRNILSLMVAVIALAASFTIIYMPKVKRKKIALLGYGPQNIYKVRISNESIEMESEGLIELSPKVLTKAYESAMVFTIKSSMLTLCIPKRILSGNEAAWLASTLKKSVRHYKTVALPDGLLKALR